MMSLRTHITQAFRDNNLFTKALYKSYACSRSRMRMITPLNSMEEDLSKKNVYYF